MSDTITLTADDGHPLFVYRWPASGQARAVVQIVHGMAEHAGRYGRLAAALNGAGFAVWAHDHRGHGRTARTPAELGHFADRDGWSRALRDVHQVRRHARRESGSLPLVALGHSMGSFMLQQAMSEAGGELAAAVLSGSSGPPPGLGMFRMLALAERLRLGRRGRSALLHRLAFGGFNRLFEPARTPFDWLSGDPEEVDRYVADPLCGFPCTTQFYRDLLGALADIARPERLAKIPGRLPVLVIAGDRDPVSSGTRTLVPLLESWRAAGLVDVTRRFYPGGRHEMFNDVDRDRVTKDLLGWLEDRVVPAAAGA